MSPPCASASVVHSHRCLQVVVGIQVVVSVTVLPCHPSRPKIMSKAEQGDADGAPLRLSQGDGAEVIGEDVGAGHGRFRLM